MLHDDCSQMKINKFYGNAYNKVQKERYLNGDELIHTRDFFSTSVYFCALSKFFLMVQRGKAFKDEGRKCFQNGSVIASKNLPLHKSDENTGEKMSKSAFSEI